MRNTKKNNARGEKEMSPRLRLAEDIVGVLPPVLLPPPEPSKEEEETTGSDTRTTKRFWTGGGLDLEVQEFLEGVDDGVDLGDDDREALEDHRRHDLPFRRGGRGRAEASDPPERPEVEARRRSPQHGVGGGGAAKEEAKGGRKEAVRAKKEPCLNPARGPCKVGDFGGVWTGKKALMCGFHTSAAQLS